jgi:hypothetical protein
MKVSKAKYLVGFLAFLFVLGSSSVWAGYPKIITPELRFDLGKIPFNCKVSHEFWVKNGGTDTLKIITVSVP